MPAVMSLLPPPQTASPASSGSATSYAPPPGQARRALARKGKGAAGSSGALRGIQTASTPNLNALYATHSSGPGANTSNSAAHRLAQSRQASFASSVLSSNALATIPDATESYAYDSVLRDSGAMAPLTPGKGGAGDDITVGDTVDVPGGMFGMVRFIGSVQGRPGTFAGVELNREYAARGKNSGDVAGVSYFSTSTPGSGIFVPLNKTYKRDTPPTSASSFPLTPMTMAPNGLKVANQNSTNFTPPTPGVSKFSQSVGPGRAASPTGKRPPRTSLPRPDSPVRRLPLAAAPRPSIATPGPKGPARFGSPTGNKFAQSIRGTAGDPSKKAPAGRERNASIGPRSASALGGPTTSGFTDDESTPKGISRTKTNGSVGSVSSMSLRRPSSRATNTAAQDEELEGLRVKLAERDRQLKDQAATLAEMESSLVEVQNMMDQPNGLRFGGDPGIGDDKDAMQLRALLREKNDKIAMLTAEFDAHRADFRSTIDTLEMASTETERVYEKKIEELMQEIHDLQERTADVEGVAAQLKQLEELVQELEEGLEDARRGEAEARGEVEFLRGEVERTRSELRREREKAQAGPNGFNGTANGERGSASKDLEQKEDEIRGLKAIIHSLSRDSIPGANGERPLSQRASSFKNDRARDSIDGHLTKDKLEREVSELRAIVDSKSRREEDLERELEQLRRGSATTNPSNQRGSSLTLGSAPQRSSLRDSRGTVVLTTRDREGPQSPLLESHKTHTRVHTLDTIAAESDAYSTATENSTLWCELCETAGHDILSCTNMFGPNAGNGAASTEKKLPPTPPPQQNGANLNSQTGSPSPASRGAARTGKDAVREGLKNLTVPGIHDAIKPPPLSPVKSKAPTSVPASVKILPNPMDSGPVAGKESGVIDAGKWCALCERDGHDSVDCPFENAF